MVAGRKSQYPVYVEPRLDEVREWASLGAPDSEIWKALGISIDTFYLYKKKYPEFTRALKQAKGIADYQVVASMFKSAAKGMYWTEVTKELRPVIRGRQSSNGKNGKNGKAAKVKEAFMVEEALVITKTVRKFIPPNIVAAIWWSKNRMHEDWKDRKAVDMNLSGDLAFQIRLPENFPASGSSNAVVRRRAIVPIATESEELSNN